MTCRLAALAVMVPLVAGCAERGDGRGRPLADASSDAMLSVDSQVAEMDASTRDASTRDASGQPDAAVLDANQQADAGPDGGKLCRTFDLGSADIIDGEAKYEPCDMFPPTNCVTGVYLWFDDDPDQCWCALLCSDLGANVGEACGTTTGTTCRYVENEDGTSKGNWCLPPEWEAFDLDCRD